MEEVHPSLDATLRTRHIDGGGADTVAKQLDILNHRFQALLAVLYDRLRQIAALSPNDPALQVSTTFYILLYKFDMFLNLYHVSLYNSQTHRLLFILPYFQNVTI